MSNKVRSRWQEKYRQYSESYEELLSFDPFEEWELNSSPEVTAEDEFRCGVEACLGGAPNQGAIFLERARRVTERALTEKELDNGLCKSSFPRNRGELLRIKAYCVGLLDGTVDCDALMIASRDIESMTRTYPEWDSQTEAYYLGAVRAALIGNHTEYAQSLLANAREFSWHKEEAQVLSKLASGDPGDREESISELYIILDRVRDPDYCPDFFFETTIARFELSALYEKAQAWHVVPDLKAALARIIA